MLDYRAQKLFQLIGFFPITLLSLISYIVIPFSVYFIGYLSSDNQITQLIYCAIALIIIEIIWMIIVFIVGKSIKAVFNTFVDIVPDDGRTKEEAELVAMGDKHTIKLIEFDKLNPRDWTDEIIEDYISIQPFSAKMFFQDRIRTRLEAVRKHYIDKPELLFNSYFMQMELENLNLHVKWDERLFSSFYGFRIIIIYGFMLYLVIFNPFNF